jgi:predicted NAD/FAD-dependent oxidoreductase
VVLPDDVQVQLSEASDVFQFDHGCQFFCALDDRFLDKIEKWQTAGVAEEWVKKCAFVTDSNCVGGLHNTDHDGEDTENSCNNDFL